MKFIISIVSALLGGVFISACTYTSGAGQHMPFASAGVAAHSTGIADYLKARFAARQQEFGIAAQAYFNVAQAAPEDKLILRQALYHELAAGRVEDAISYATKISQLDAASPHEIPTTQMRERRTSRWLDRFLPYLVLAADAARKERYEEARMLLEKESGSSSYARSLTHLVARWMDPRVVPLMPADHLADIQMQISTPKSDIFTGFIALHQAFLLDLAGDTSKTDAAYQSAMNGFHGEVAALYRVAFLERLATADLGMYDAAIAELRDMVRQNNPIRRAARLALLRLDQPLEGESRRMKRLAGKSPIHAVGNGRDGMAMVLYNFAYTSLQQVMFEHDAISRTQVGEARLLLEVPLALAQIAVYLKPDFHDARYLIGQIYAAYNLHEEAMAYFLTIPVASPYHVFAQLNVATLLRVDKETGRAMKTLAKFYQRDRLVPEIAQAYAELLAEQGDYEEAIVVATQMIAAAHRLYAPIGKTEQQKSAIPANALLWRYYFARAAIYVQHGNWEAAEADLRAAMVMAPEQPVLLNFLGYSWAERGENLEEAFALIEKALRHYPYNGSIIDSLGWAHYQLGHFDESVMHLERAVQLVPSNPTVTDHLGDAYWQTGRKIEARYQWRYALGLNPEPALRQNIEAKIAHGLVPPLSVQRDVEHRDMPLPQEH